MARTPYRGDGFSVPASAKLADVKPSTLDYWIRTGLIKPSVLRAGRGRGNTRALAWRELVALRVAAELRRSGVPLQGIRRAVKHLRRRYKSDEPLADQRLVYDGTDVYLRRGEEAVSLLRQPGQVALFVLDFAGLVADLRERADLEERKRAALG